MMSQDILSLIIAPLLTAIVTWFFARSKNRQEVIKMKTENEIQAAQYYQDLLDDMSKRLSNSIEEIDELMKRNKELMRSNRELLDANQKLMETNKELAQTNERLIVTNQHLVNELQKFKQLNGKPKDGKKN